MVNPPDIDPGADSESRRWPWQGSGGQIAVGTLVLLILCTAAALSFSPARATADAPPAADPPRRSAIRVAPATTAQELWGAVDGLHVVYTEFLPATGALGNSWSLRSMAAFTQPSLLAAWAAGARFLWLVSVPPPPSKGGGADGALFLEDGDGAWLRDMVAAAPFGAAFIMPPTVPRHATIVAREVLDIAADVFERSDHRWRDLGIRTGEQIRSTESLTFTWLPPGAALDPAFLLEQQQTVRAWQRHHAGGEAWPPPEEQRAALPVPPEFREYASRAADVGEPGDGARRRALLQCAAHVVEWRFQKSTTGFGYFRKEEERESCLQEGFTVTLRADDSVLEASARFVISRSTQWYRNMQVVQMGKGAPVIAPRAKVVDGSWPGLKPKPPRWCGTDRLHDLNSYMLANFERFRQWNREVELLEDLQEAHS